MRQYIFDLRLLCLVFMTLLVSITACTKYDDPAPVFEVQDSTKIQKTRKVLLISIDGAVGAEVGKLQPPHIKAMLSSSKYTWDAFSDAQSNDASTWVNMMTGVSAQQHGIVDSTFLVPEGSEHDAIAYYPTFIQRVQDAGKNLWIVAVSPWDNLINKLMVYANEPISVANDQAVKDTVLAKLKKDNLGLVVVNFNGVNKAGIAGGFTLDNAAYKNALLKCDGYIGEIMDAIKARENYAGEDWLVILTSNHGADGTEYGGPTRKERNVFMLYYNMNLQGAEIPAPALVEAVKLSGEGGSAIRAEIPDDEGKYNLGDEGEYTIQFKLKIHDKGSINPAFFSKTNLSYGNNPQWAFMFQGDGQWRNIIGSSGKSLRYLVGESLPLEEWHTLSLKIFEEDGKRYATNYTDGEPHDTVDITGYDITNAATLKAGYVSGYFGNPAVVTLSDVRFYNTALPDEEIVNSLCSFGIDSSNPYYDNLIGYWMGNEGVGDQLKNLSPLAQNIDFELRGSFNWAYNSANACNTEVEGAVLMNSSDIVSQIYYWLGIKPDDSWDLEGNLWLPKYESEFIK